MQACRNRRNTSLRERESSHALVEHLRTFAYGHSHYGPEHHRRRFQRRFWCIQKVGVKCSTAKVCKWKHVLHEKNAPQRRLRGVVQVLNEQFESESGSWWIQQRGALRCDSCCRTVLLSHVTPFAFSVIAALPMLTRPQIPEDTNADCHLWNGEKVPWSKYMCASLHFESTLSEWPGKRFSNRPLRRRWGRFGTLLQQLE